MSGIAGIIHFDGAFVEPGLIQKMTSAMAHRGPDGINHWVKGGVALGQCMLRTTPESLEERQPLTNEDESLVLVMDGRVDNWEDLRRALLGRETRLRDRSDAELVLRAYEIWGEDCVAHIDGDFAFVIWDMRRRAALCARDRMGNKPLNYHWNGRTLTVASELRAVVATGNPSPALNETLLAQYLGNEWYSREETFWKGITRLPPAHLMRVNEGVLSIASYWAPDLFKPLPYERDEDNVAHYRETITDVVRRLSRSHRPTAYEVSGGLDSSSIVCVAHALRHESRLPTPGLLAYTLDFSGDSEACELDYAREVGEHLGLPVREVKPGRRSLAWYRAEAASSWEFPGYPNGTMALTLRDEASAAGSRAVLGGGGGDEWLGLGQPGYYYAEELQAGRWRPALDCATEDASNAGVLRTVAWVLRSGMAPLLPTSFRGVARFIHHRLSGRWGPSPTAPPRGEAWLAPRLLSLLRDQRTRHASAPQPEAHHRSQRLQWSVLNDAYATLAREAEERSLARQGLELRQPYHSQAIVQFAFSSPERMRSLGRSTKRFHRRAIGNLLPASIAGRTTKADFMGAFRSGLDDCEAELKNVIARRSGDWLEKQLALELATRRRDPELAGWVEWPLWSLIGCDALVS